MMGISTGTVSAFLKRSTVSTITADDGSWVPLQYGLGIERESVNVLACVDLSIAVWI